MKQLTLQLGLKYAIIGSNHQTYIIGIYAIGHLGSYDTNYNDCLWVSCI